MVSSCFGLLRDFSNSKAEGYMLPVFSLLMGWLSSEGTETTYVTKAAQSV